MEKINQKLRRSVLIIINNVIIINAEQEHQKLKSNKIIGGMKYE